jgi:hypothetical protein
MAEKGSAAACATPGSALSLLLVLCGCGGGGGTPFGQTAGATETDGVVTTSVDGGAEGAGDNTDGADETAGEPQDPDQIPYYCIYNDDNPMDLVGVKHQCNLEYDLDISFWVTPLVGPAFQVPLVADSVQTLNDSTYAHPYVMACCTDVTTRPEWPFDDSCSYLHHTACLSDFLEHVCDAPGVWLEKAAHDYVGQGAEAIEAAADWFKDHRQECYDHFWMGPDALSGANLCDPEFDSTFHHTPWEPHESWTYYEPITHLVVAEVSNVVIAPHSSLDEHVPQAPPIAAESCMLPDSNNGETPPLSLPGPTGSTGILASPVAPVSINVVGPELAQEAISGSGDFSTDSVLQWHTNGSNLLEIERWSMVEDAATTVGTSSLTASVDGFKLDLLGPETAAVITGGWEIGAESALFNLIATVDSVGSNVQATNAVPIKLYAVNGGVGACPATVVSCLVSRPFTIGYEDAFGHSWELDIPTTTWTP